MMMMTWKNVIKFFGSKDVWYKVTRPYLNHMGMVTWIMIRVDNYELQGLLTGMDLLFFSLESTYKYSPKIEHLLKHGSSIN